MKNRNIILFSSGVSEQNGVLGEVRTALARRGYCCSDWRELFASANDANRIALLPTLIKKIPTFDYAVLICEGHDLTTICRSGATEQVKSMRDNVLFEIGLCAMALGLSRTILVTDRDVRIPDDLVGVNDALAIERINLYDDAGQLCDAEGIARQIDAYVQETGDALHQVVIGAACSTACGYISNFVSRVLEHADEEICITMDGRTETMHLPIDRIHLHIHLLEEIDAEVEEKLTRVKAGLARGRISSARSRPANFDCYFEGDELHIVDYPTNMITSYETARMILELDADDALDQDAQRRFTAKELNLYESTLRSLLNREHIGQVIRQFYASVPESAQQRIADRVLDVVENRLTIQRMRL